MEKSFRISNKSLFEQPSGTDYVQKPRFDCSGKSIFHAVLGYHQKKSLGL